MTDRGPVVEALRSLDDEAFTFMIVQLWQFSKTRGGFRDKIGLAELERRCLLYMNEASADLNLDEPAR